MPVNIRDQFARGSIRELFIDVVESGAAGDFPYLTANVLNKVLQREYNMVPDQWRPICRVATLPDFKEKQIDRLSEAEDLLEVREGEEYKDSKITEEKESYKVAKYGRLFSVTWELIVNDDLDGIIRQPQKFGRAAARLLNKLVFQGILEANPVMGDGKTLFHADHKNLFTGTETAFSSTALETALTNFRKQTELSGQQIAVKARYIAYHFAKDFAVKKVLNSGVYVTTSMDATVVNVLRGIVEPLDIDWFTQEDPWYLIANPRDIDTIEMGFLRMIGQRPELFLKASDAVFAGGGGAVSPMTGDFKFDRITYKVRHVAAAKAIDWRGMQKQAGA